ncbi:alpha/beta hydrolase [Embleya sp. NPDC059259]|uniref:alpha/beta hydrolase n=1 Tax=unclassified Embleya TaxID=2699296 RepID=UPI003699B227
MVAPGTRPDPNDEPPSAEPARSEGPPHPTGSHAAPPPPPPASRIRRLLAHPYPTIPPNTRRVVRRWPDLIGMCVATAFLWLSLTPSLLPRPWPWQGLIGGLAGIAGYALGVLAATAIRACVARRPGERFRVRAWWAYYLVAGIGTVAGLVWSAQAQRRLRALQGLNPSSPWNGLMIVVITLGTGLLLLTLARGLRLAARTSIRWLGRRLPRPLAYVLGPAAVTLLVVVSLHDVVWERGFIGFVDHTAKAINGAIDPNLPRPDSPLRSGGPGSLVSWHSLGANGRKFVAQATDPALITRFTGRPAAVPIRVYIGENPEDEDFREAADLAVRELDRTGAWTRAVLAVQATTGSGWVDPNLAAPLEYMYAGDTATVAIQYSYLPSWISFLVDRGRAERAQRALYHAVRARWSALPAADRPRLVLGGESLGAYATDAVFADPAELIAGADAVVLEGPPFASRLWNRMEDDRDRGSPVWRPVYDGGRHVRFGQFPATDLRRPPGPWERPRIVYLQNASDPVVWWSPDLLFDKPAWLHAPLGPDITREVRYYPIITFWQTTVDLAVSFGTTAPHGHRYGNGAAVAWAATLPPPNWTDTDTDRLLAFMAQHPLRH